MNLKISAELNLGVTMHSRGSSRVRWIVAPIGALTALAAAVERIESADLAFESARAFDVGVIGPLVHADLNGDGRTDIASFGDVLGVLIGRRPDGFEPARSFAGTFLKEPGIIADFDRDGVVDVAGLSRRGVAVLLGNGTGSFGAERLFADSRRYEDIAAGDFDEDGNVDVVLSASSHDAIAVLLSDGRGGFGAASTLAIPAESQRRALVVAEFTSDGRVDVALTGATSAVHVFPGDGLGGLGPSIESSAPYFAEVIESVDVNEDGQLDLLVVGRPDQLADDRTGFLLGDGEGRFSHAGFLDATRRTRSAVTGDFDRDGHVDVAVARYGQFVTVLLGDGSGAFGLSGHFSTGGIGAIQAADFDEDGDNDLAYEHGDRVCISMGDGTGGFAAAREFSGEDGGSGGVLAIGRFDADAHMDVALLGDRTVTSYSGDGSGGFVKSHSTLLQRSGFAITSGDLDDDGDSDAVVTHLSGGDDLITVLLSAGDGRFSTNPYAIQAPYDAAIADFDRDGIQDLVVVNAVLGPDPDFGGVSFLRGLGAGRFTAPITSPSGIQPRKVRAGDFDRDGILDLAIGKLTGESEVFFLRGEGDGRFAPIQSLASGFPVASMIVADFDRDSHIDVAWGDYRAGQGCTLWIYRGDGAFGFSLSASLSVESTPSDLVANDFDRDGDLDIALANPTIAEAEVTLFQGDGAGLFEPVSFSLPLRFGSKALTSADFDEDGQPDLAAATAERPGFWIFLNRTFDPIRSRAGNANSALGPLASPLRINASTGEGVERRISLDRDDPIDIAMEAPPSRPDGPSKFALYAWLGVEPSAATVRRLPDNIGFSSLPMPLSSASAPQPAVIWNNIGRTGRLGIPTLPSSPAPSIVLRRMRVPRRPAAIFLQGLLLDNGAPNERAAVTNGIAARIR